MEFFYFITFFSCLSFTLATPVSKRDTILSTASTDIETASKQLDVLASFAINTTQQALQNQSSTSLGGCTLSNLAVRKEWGALSATERVEYTDAVRCLQSKPAKTPSELVPGAKSRYDDFVASHINQTLTVHNTGIFLAWHRYFTYEYEQALRTECGYTGYQPYWNWGITARDGVENSPIFDGSDTSMSGNGIQVPGEGSIIIGGLGLPNTTLPHGNGGGCVTSGPFKDMEVNLGPVLLAVANGTNVGNTTDKFRYNPRCLKRDLSVEINQLYANMSSIASLILESSDVETFQNVMQGTPDTGIFGVHAGAHYVLGGDPGRDIFTSPGDPAFYLNHGMIDRVWWIWQQQDRAVREKAVAGTATFLNNPPSANTTLDTVTDLGFAAGSPIKIEDLMSTTGGPFCYTYA